MLNIQHKNINSPVRITKGKAELFNSSVLSATGEVIYLKDVSNREPKATTNINVKCLGKNLFNYNTVNWVVNGGTYTNDNSITTFNGTGYYFYTRFEAVNYRWIKNGLKYTFSEEVLSYSDSGANPLTVAIVAFYTDNTYTENNKIITAPGRITATIQTDANKDISYIEIRPIRKGNLTSTLNAQIKNMQLQIIDTDSSYEAYKEPVESVNNEIRLHFPNATIYTEGTENINITYTSGYKYIKDYTYRDNLKSFNIERTGEGKFFGFGICQRLNIHLVDKDRLINITTGNAFKPYLSTAEDYISAFPTFYVTETHRDELTNELSTTAYDALYGLSEHFWSEVDITPPYTLKGVVAAVCAFMGCSWDSNAIDSFNLEYAEGANLEGTETLREILNAVADATQTIYYLDSNNNLYFKRLDKDGTPVLTITKDDYITLKSGDNRRLTKIINTTELGDSVSSSSLDITGTTQFIWNNPFLELREDIDILLEKFINDIGGLTINQFECSFRGNFLLEPGDKLNIITKDNKTVTTYLLDETVNYNGFLSSSLKWAYADNDTETAENPATLGDALKYTYARVDKVNKQVDIVVSDLESLSKIQMTTENILASVNSEIDDLNQKAELAITKEDVSIQIQNELNSGVDKVITSTGFTFNDEGLTVSKSGSEMTTQITEDGMIVSRDRNEVLTADNTGVKAENLHATTYLIVGNNSRFEDFGGRTGCFWIG